MFSDQNIRSFSARVRGPCVAKVVFCGLFIRHFMQRSVKVTCFKYNNSFQGDTSVVVLIVSCLWCYRERAGVEVERRTPNRQVLGSIPTGVTVLCP